jgi:hypothetical protein
MKNDANLLQVGHGMLAGLLLPAVKRQPANTVCPATTANSPSSRSSSRLHACSAEPLLLQGEADRDKDSVCNVLQPITAPCTLMCTTPADSCAVPASCSTAAPHNSNISTPVRRKKNHSRDGAHRGSILAYPSGAAAARARGVSAAGLGGFGDEALGKKGLALKQPLVKCWHTPHQA